VKIEFTFLQYMKEMMREYSIRLICADTDYADSYLRHLKQVALRSYGDKFIFETNSELVCFKIGEKIAHYDAVIALKHTRDKQVDSTIRKLLAESKITYKHFVVCGNANIFNKEHDGFGSADIDYFKIDVINNHNLLAPFQYILEEMIVNIKLITASRETTTYEHHDD
jgi:hypothetical protein